jgi:putative endonuclease
VYLYFVYILGCSDNSYYVGVTNNLERRLNEHNEGEDKKAYTYIRRPVKVLFHAEFNDVNEAISFEKKLKGWSRNKKEAIIDGEWDLLLELAKCKNKTRFDR